MAITRFTVAWAFALTLVSWPSVAANVSPKDFDLACAMTNGAVFGSEQETAEKRSAALQVWTFYIGRLTGRDDNTDWAAVALGRVAELKERARSDKLFSDCMDFYLSKIK
jgi:hypothetical protein